MRLSELNPGWVHENVFVFKCPHCRDIWLSCKSVAMLFQDQFRLFRDSGVIPDDGLRRGVVPMEQDCSWTIDGRDFETMTVTPSIDASASGHWHGFITKGEIK